MPILLLFVFDDDVICLFSFGVTVIFEIISFLIQKQLKTVTVTVILEN